jgi:hypothetical protein
VEWESREWNGKEGDKNNCRKADPSVKSFLFTLKNPHNFSGGKFALKAEWKDRAIHCHSSLGPRFVDIGVSDNCNANMGSYTYFFGSSYVNLTGLDAAIFFTGLWYFTVKEIEIFEITGETAHSKRARRPWKL